MASSLFSLFQCNTSYLQLITNIIDEPWITSNDLMAGSDSAATCGTRGEAQAWMSAEALLVPEAPHTHCEVAGQLLLRALRMIDSTQWRHLWCHVLTVSKCDCDAVPLRPHTN